MPTSLLIAIDLQTGWRHKSATEQAMLKAVELCKQFDGDIIHCCFKNDPTSAFHTQLRWQRFVSHADTDQIPEVAPLNLPVYWRPTYSCLTPEVRKLVLGYDHVYIVGVFTDISVFVTALDIFDMNITVSVVSDCVASLHGEQAHKSALHSLDFALGSQNIVTSDQLLKKLL